MDVWGGLKIWTHVEMWTRREGGKKWTKICGCPLWMAPKVYTRAFWQFE